MMNDALSRQFSGIIVWKLDRFSREGIIPTMSYIKQLKDRGIFLKSLTESWLDTQNEGITDVVLAIMSWAAAEERKKISERTKAGIARRRAIGQWKGGRPKKTTSNPVISQDNIPQIVRYRRMECPHCNHLNSPDVSRPTAQCERCKKEYRTTQ